MNYYGYGSLSTREKLKHTLETIENIENKIAEAEQARRLLEEYKEEEYKLMKQLVEEYEEQTI